MSYSAIDFRYEGTGRSLSLKLLQQIRSQAGGNSKIGSHTGTSKNQTSGRVLYELTLEESIRYRPGDVIERWLSDLLCLDATSVQPILSGYPTPDDCDLYYINRYIKFTIKLIRPFFSPTLMVIAYALVYWKGYSFLLSHSFRSISTTTGCLVRGISL